MKSLLENKKVRIALIAFLILIVLLLIIGLILNGSNKINKQQDSKQQARERIEQILEMAKAAKENNENYNSNEYLDSLLKNNSITVNGNIVSSNGYNFEIDRENLNINNELGSTNVDISSEVIESTGKDENGRDLGKVAINLTSNIPIDMVQIENVDGTIIQENVNSTTYEKEIDVVFGHTHIISVVTSDGKIKMHKITKEKPEPIKDPIESSEIRTGNPLNFTWEEINEIAQIISDDSRITSNTQQFTLTYKGNNYTIGVGDYTTLAGKQVRIMGFNHDTLTNKNAYGGTNTYAGISFEFAEIWYKGAIHDEGSGAIKNWEQCSLRSALNNGKLSSLENRTYIKQVSKLYYDTWYKKEKISQDKLWLLSTIDIYSNVGGAKPYKYYVNNTSNTHRKKFFNNSSADWWLRNQTNSYDSFQKLTSSGSLSNAPNYYNYGVAPGFCI